jgi:hypothetical protein
MDHFQTYNLLARCLSLDFAESQRQPVIRAFESQDFDTGKFLKTADNHLVIQSLYPLLEKHDLLSHIPAELADHLEMVFKINATRNEKITGQVQVINALLSRENIFPLYLKGTGNILDGLYPHPGQRILHDIDFLVEDMNFEKAAGILLKNGYHSYIPFNPENIKDIKHYPILHHENFPAHVEIHRIPVNKKYAVKFTSEMVFRDKVRPLLASDCFVMSNGHRAIHTFIHSQLEDKGYYYAKASLRSMYDMLLLSGRVSLEDTFSAFGHYRRKSEAFLDIMYKTFGIKPAGHSSFILNNYLHSTRFFLNHRYRLVNLLSYFLLRTFLAYIINPFLAITDKELRKLLIGKLKDRNWYGKHFGRYRKFFGGG